MSVAVLVLQQPAGVQQRALLASDSHARQLAADTTIVVFSIAFASSCIAAAARKEADGSGRQLPAARLAETPVRLHR